MPDIKDIAALDNYTGSKELGGFIPNAIEISTKPVEQLAAYTIGYNFKQYQQAQINADQKIKELADLTAYDLVNGRGKDKDQVIDAQAKLTNYMAEFAAKGTPKTPKEKIEQQLEFQTKIKDQLKLINGANTRAIGYSAQRDLIDKDQTITAPEKERQLKELDNLFDNTDIYTPIPALPKFKAPDTNVGDAPIKETAIVKIGPNGFTEEKTNVFDPAAAMNESFLLYNNLKLTEPGPNATPLEKQQYEQRKNAGDTNTVWQQAYENYQHAITDPKYKKTITNDATAVIAAPSGTVVVTDEVDYDKIKQANPIIGGIIDLADRYNQYAEKMREQADTYYTDAAGNKVKLLPAINAKDYQPLDKNNLSGQDLIFLQKFAKAKPDKVEKNYTNTGEATKIELEKLQQSGQNYRARLAAASKGDGNDKEPEYIDKPAILFGQHIERLKSTFDKNGGKSIEVGFAGTDKKTRIATGIKVDEKIVYKPDGSYEILDKKKKVRERGTIENLAQGFIEAVKTTDIDASKDKDGTMSEGFQRKSEAKFQQAFGTTSGKAIWDSWGKAQDATTQPTTPATTSTDADTIPVGTILVGPDGTKIKTNKVITKKEAADAGYK